MPGSRRASIVLPVPGGPTSSRLCAPGRGDLERTPCPLLAAHVGQLRSMRRVASLLVDGRWRPSLAAEIRHRLGRCRTGTGSIPASATSAPDSAAQISRSRPGPARSLGGNERTDDGAQPPVERQLTERGVTGQRPGWKLPRGGEDGQRDRQVESRPLLAQGRRSEVDRDAPFRPRELGGGDAAANSLLRLLAGAIGEADDRKRRVARLDVRLDFDPPWIEPDERMCDGPCEHVVTVDDRVCT